MRVTESLLQPTRRDTLCSDTLWCYAMPSPPLFSDCWKGCEASAAVGRPWAPDKHSVSFSSSMASPTGALTSCQPSYSGPRLPSDPTGKGWFLQTFEFHSEG